MRLQDKDGVPFKGWIIIGQMIAVHLNAADITLVD